MMHGFQQIVTQAECRYDFVVHGLPPLGDDIAVSPLIWRKKLMDSISGNLGYCNNLSDAERVMVPIDESAIYDDLLDLLAESVEAERVLAFRLSAAKQARLDTLLDKNRDGTLTAEERAELDAYERFEHVVRLLKARVLQKLGP
jgi:hypothetical protein